MKHSIRIIMLVLLILLCQSYAPAQGQPPASASPKSQAEQIPSETKANTAAAPQAKDNWATVYIYRPKKLFGAALEPSIFCNGIELGRMDNGRYLMLKLEPGTYRFHMTDKSKRVEESLKPGQVLYLRFRLEAGMWKGQGAVYLADEEDALKELKNLKPLGADKLKDKTMVVTDSAEADAETKKRVREFTQAQKDK